MPQSLRFDTHDLTALAEDFEDAAAIAPEQARKVVAKGCLNIKNDARQRIAGLPHAPAYPASITYDTTLQATGAAGEVGPDKDRRQGALGNILEFGTRNNPPRPHLGPAAEAEEPRFVSAMQDLAAKALG